MKKEIKNPDLEEFLVNAGITSVWSKDHTKDGAESYLCYLSSEEKLNLDQLKEPPFLLERAGSNIRKDDKGHKFIYITKAEYETAVAVFKSLYGGLKKSFDEFITNANKLGIEIDYKKQHFADGKIKLIFGNSFKVRESRAILMSLCDNKTLEGGDSIIYLDQEDINDMKKALKRIRESQQQPEAVRVKESRQAPPENGGIMDRMCQVMRVMNFQDKEYEVDASERGKKVNAKITFTGEKGPENAEKFVSVIYDHDITGPKDGMKDVWLKRRIHEEGDKRVVYIENQELRKLYEVYIKKPSPVATGPNAIRADNQIPNIEIVAENIFGAADHNPGPMKHKNCYVDPASPETESGIKGRDGHLSGAIYKKISGGYENVLDKINSEGIHKIIQYDSAINIGETFGVLSIAGPEGSKIKNQAGFTQKLQQVYKTIIEKIIENKDSYDQFNVPIMSGGVFADVHKPNIGKITAEAIYGAITEISQDGKISSQDLKQALGKTKLCCADSVLASEIGNNYKSLQSQASAQGAAVGRT